MLPTKKRYKLGNVLRGYLTGEYHTTKEAWMDLCSWFDNRLEKPSPRNVSLYVEGLNKYGYKQFLICREGNTPGLIIKKNNRKNIPQEIKEVFKSSMQITVPRSIVDSALKHIELGCEYDAYTCVQEWMDSQVNTSTEIIENLKQKGDKV